jgi:predicted AlkP superfamily pyrophosphatase or phosphodiesterase
MKNNSGEKKNHLFIISFDAVYEADFEVLKTLPNCQFLIEHGSYSKQVKTIYPTITYPVHTSIITGCYPDKHGIFHNHPFQPHIKNDKYKRWFWYHDEIKAPTLLDVARQNNLKVGSIFWPVTGKAKIAYNLPEIIALPGENQILKILKAGSPLFLLLNELKYRKLRKGIEEPNLANFTTKVSCNLIEKKKPQLGLVHLVTVDTFRHNHGTHGKKTLEGLRRLDDSLGEIMNAIGRAEIWDESTIIVTTDHGQMDCNRYASINAYFIEAGLQSWQGEQTITFHAYAQSLGFGAYIHINPELVKTTPEFETKLSKVLEQLKEDQIISYVISKEELLQKGCSEEFDFAIESYPNVYITDSIYHQFHQKSMWMNELTENERKQIQHDLYYATHGYDNETPGYQNIFFAYGPNVKKNYDIGPMSMVDIAPTVAKLMNLTFPSCDGIVLTNLLKEEV